MYFAVLLVLMKRSSSHRSLISKCIALHIGGLSDSAVWFPSSGENLAFMYFLSSTYVEDKKNQPRNKTA